MGGIQGFALRLLGSTQRGFVTRALLRGLTRLQAGLVARFGVAQQFGLQPLGVVHFQTQFALALFQVGGGVLAQRIFGLDGFHQVNPVLHQFALVFAQWLVG